MINCLDCGKPFRQVHLMRFTCRGKCTARHQVRVFRLRREWIRMAPLVTPYLLERDHRQCGICHKPIRARTGRMRPSADHIVPLNRGGSNDLANLQITHLSCNAAKCDRGGGQLLLFG